jgi:hypothetical protein
MPNTIAHLGLHALSSRVIFSKADIKWIYLGAILPDIPFVMKRAATYIAPNVDILDVRLFAIVQASLIFSLVLAFACSRLSSRSRHVFLVLSFGVLLHLIIDAFQIKWGNGPRFLAPFDWSLTNFGFFWPEQLPSYLMTALGGVYVIYAFTLPIREQARDLILPGPRGLLALVTALAIYLLLPLVFMDAVEQSDGGSVQLIRSEERSGHEIELDRAGFRRDGSRMTVELYRGEFITLAGIGQDFPAAGKVSVRGSFVAHDVIRANEFHINDTAYRELASIIGLSIVAIYWLIVLVGRFRKS